MKRRAATVHIVSRSGLAYEDHAPTEDYDDPVLTIGGIEPVDGFNRLLPTCLVEGSTNRDGNSGSGTMNPEFVIQNSGFMVPDPEFPRISQSSH